MGDTHPACLSKHRLRSTLNKSLKQKFIGLQAHCNHTKVIRLSMICSTGCTNKSYLGYKEGQDSQIS